MGQEAGVWTGQISLDKFTPPPPPGTFQIPSPDLNFPPQELENDNIIYFYMRLANIMFKKYRRL